MLKSICSFCVWLILSAGLADAALVPIGDWPADGTHTAIVIDQQLFRNCGRILERWDLETDPPHLLDSLVLDSAPIDLMDWDGLLLVLQEDGTLEIRHLADGWDPPIWSLELSNCATKLLRHGRWLLPVSPWMPLLDLENPRDPVVAQDYLGWGGNWPGNFGGFDACFVGDTLIGDYSDCCGSCWDVVMGACWMTLNADGPGLPSEWVPMDGDWWPWDWASPIIAADQLGLVWSNPVLSCFDPADWSLRQSVDFPVDNVVARLASNDSLVLASSSAALSLFQVSNQEEPPVRLLDTLAVAADQQLRFMDNEALAISRDRTTWLSLVDPEHLTVSRELPAMGEIRAVAWAGDHLLVRQRCLEAFSADVAGINPVARLDLGDGVQLAGSGDLAIADVPGGVAVIDLSQALVPHVSTILPTVNPQSLFCLEDELMAYLDSDQLVVASLENPAQPVERFRLQVGSPHGLAMGGGVIALWENYSTLRLFDARDPLHVVESGSLPFAGFFTFCGDLLALAWQTEFSRYSTVHLQLYDLANPSQPIPLQELQWEFHDLQGLWASPDRIMISVHLQPIWGYPNDYILFDVIEGQGFVQTAQWSIEPYEGQPDYHLLQGARLVSHEPGQGLRLSLDDSILGVDQGAHGIIETFAISAAPNPFNPRTILEINLERAGPARLAVYDLLGREVAVLLDGPQVAGTQRIAFDGGNLASGLYLARLEAAGATRTIKLALVR